MVTDNKKKSVTIVDEHKICRNTSKCCILTKAETKEYKIVFDKHVIMDNYVTLPYGMQMCHHCIRNHGNEIICDEDNNPCTMPNVPLMTSRMNTVPVCRYNKCWIMQIALYVDFPIVATEFG